MVAVRGIICDMKRKAFWDLPLVAVNESEWQAELMKLVGRPQKCTQIVYTPNPEQLVLASRDEEFHELLRQADYLIPDGVGLVWASGVPARLTGADSVEFLLRYAWKHHLRVLLIGGRYQARENKLILRLDGQEMAINYACGYEQAQMPTKDEENRVQNLIKKIKPTIVMVALGAPAQEKWLAEHRMLLSENEVSLAMAVGGSFDFLTGKLKRAPVWMRQWRLEWLYRLVQEPKRWRRQLALPVFVLKKLTGGWQTVQENQGR